MSPVAAALSPYELAMRHGFTAIPSGCLEFNGYRNKLGYGQVRWGGRLHRVHRVMYERQHGPIPEGLELRHTCDNPPCAADGHLLLGTHAENMADMMERGRHPKEGWTVCPNNHPYPEDRPARSSKNRCRECTRARQRRYDERKRARR